jgi:hypothetical protein
MSPQGSVRAFRSIVTPRPGQSQELGLYVPDLQPQHQRGWFTGVAAAGHLEQPVAQEEHQAAVLFGAELAGDGQPQHVAVEALGPGQVHGPQQHPA